LCLQRQSPPYVVVFALLNSATLVALSANNRSQNHVSQKFNGFRL
jgi:hypothetical protein